MNVDPNPPPGRAEPLDDLASYLQGMREQERAHLARELHDELGSLLTGAKLDVACLQARLGGQSADVDQHLQHLADTLSRGIALKSSIVEGLCPSTLSHLGLVAAVEILAREFAASSGVHVETDLHEVALDEATQLAVYRLVQEALTNIGKYAGASRAEIMLRKRGRDAVVTVRDNGAGFDVERLQTSHHGLAAMRHRIEHCGGRLDVASSTAAGTRIVAVLPGDSAQPMGCMLRPAHDHPCQRH
jgi:signal transduction histidine kinase